MGTVNHFPFEVNRKFIPRLKKTVSIKAANLAKQHFVMSFKKEGFTDGSFKRWKPSGQSRRGGKTLTDTGRLRRSIKPVSISFRRSRIKTVGVVYARRHNDGLNMTKRQFIGNSKQLTKKTAQMIAKEFLKVLV